MAVGRSDTTVVVSAHDEPSHLDLICMEFSYLVCLSERKTDNWSVSELQIRGGIEDNSKIYFLIFQRKHML